MVRTFAEYILIALLSWIVVVASLNMAALARDESKKDSRSKPSVPKQPDPVSSLQALSQPTTLNESDTNNWLATYGHDFLKTEFSQHANLQLNWCAQFLLIIWSTILQKKPIHIEWDAMKNILLHYTKWGGNLGYMNRGLVLKVHSAAIILAHQVARYDWFLGAPEDDEDKQQILKVIEEDPVVSTWKDFFIRM